MRVAGLSGRFTVSGAALALERNGGLKRWTPGCGPSWGGVEDPTARRPSRPTGSPGGPGGAGPCAPGEAPGRGAERSKGPLVPKRPGCAARQPRPLAAPCDLKTTSQRR